MAKGMIVAPQPEAVEAGAVVLRNGGNAVDAAITCALVQTVVDPQMCGIAGFGSMHLYLPTKGFHGFIDFHTTAPSKVREDMWEDLIEGEARDGFGFFLKGQVNEMGYQSIMVPGSLKAYYQAVTEFGKMDWQNIVMNTGQSPLKKAAHRPRKNSATPKRVVESTSMNQATYGDRVHGLPTLIWRVR